MHIHDIMEAIRTDLDGWVKERRGVLCVAKDPWDALEKLCTGPQGIIYVLSWAGDQAAGEQPQEPLGDNAIELSVGYNLGMDAKRDSALMESHPDRPSLFQLTDEARARLLTYVFADQGEPQFMAHGGTTQVVLPDGSPLAAYRIRATVLMRVELDPVYRGPGSGLLGQ
jgi:hypothetical protein